MTQRLAVCLDELDADPSDDSIRCRVEVGCLCLTAMSLDLEQQFHGEHQALLWLSVEKQSVHPVWHYWSVG